VCVYAIQDAVHVDFGTTERALFLANLPPREHARKVESVVTWTQPERWVLVAELLQTCRAAVLVCIAVRIIRELIPA